MVGALWRAGAPVDFKGLRNGAPRRIALPTYPFERKRFWIDPPAESAPRRPPQPQGAASPGDGDARTAGSSKRGDIEALVSEQLSIIEAQLEILGRR